MQRTAFSAQCFTAEVSHVSFFSRYRPCRVDVVVVVVADAVFTLLGRNDKFPTSRKDWGFSGKRSGVERTEVLVELWILTYNVRSIGYT